MSKTHSGDLALRITSGSTARAAVRPAGPPGASRPQVPLPEVRTHVPLSTRGRPDPDPPRHRARPPDDDLHRGPLPECHRGLRVRTSHLGREVGCKYCEHQFLLSLDPSCESLALTEMNAQCPASGGRAVRPRRMAIASSSMIRSPAIRPEVPGSGAPPEGAVRRSRGRRPRRERRAPDEPEASPDRRGRTGHASSQTSPLGPSRTSSPGGCGGPHASRRWPRPACSAAASPCT